MTKMTNKEAVSRIEQSGSARISKLFWLAGCTEDRDLKDYLNDLDSYHLIDLFPSIFNTENVEITQGAGTVLEEILDDMKFGFLAEVHFPKCDNFRYEKNKPVSWSTHTGHCRIEYLYAETTEDLILLIESAWMKLFNEFLAADKKKK